MLITNNSEIVLKSKAVEQLHISALVDIGG